VGHPLSLPELDVPHLLRQYGVHPNRSLGQNFLVDGAALREVVDAARLTSQDFILEIGAGLGSLTRLLAVKVGRVVAVEIDRQLLPVLKTVVAAFSNVIVVEGDILSLNPVNLVPASDYLVVANIPYNITSALIRHLLEASKPPRCLVLTVQQEVAQRICAHPGDMSLLALSVQVYGHPEITAKIPAGAFYPPPRVDSAVIRIERYPAPLIPIDQIDSFFQLIKAGFSQKRKTLRNALSAGLRCSAPEAEALLQTAGIDPIRRAETLSLDEWRKLTTVFISRFHKK
jgi:16S rRNA (adenine1518-N6/adenine1519-N6)-dimethyltransferase